MLATLTSLCSNKATAIKTAFFGKLEGEYALYQIWPTHIVFSTDWMADSPRIDRKSVHRADHSDVNYRPEVDLESILELRTNESVYTRFFVILCLLLEERLFGGTF